MNNDKQSEGKGANLPPPNNSESADGETEDETCQMGLATMEERFRDKILAPKPAPTSLEDGLDGTDQAEAVALAENEQDHWHGREEKGCSHDRDQNDAEEEHRLEDEGPQCRQQRQSSQSQVYPKKHTACKKD